MTVRDEIASRIAQKTHASAPIRGETHLYRDLGMDSLSFITLLLEIEEDFSVAFEIAEMEQCLLFDRLVGLVEVKTEEDAHGRDQKRAD